MTALGPETRCVLIRMSIDVCDPHVLSAKLDSLTLFSHLLFSNTMNRSYRI